MNDGTDSGPTRAIGKWGSFSTVAGSMLGVGIFLVPPEVAGAMPDGLGFFSVWMFAALAALSGAVAYSELGGMFPHAGGDYLFQREAYGGAVAFATGWVLFAGIFTGSIAALAVPLFNYQIATLAEAVGWAYAPDAVLVPLSGGAGLTVAQSLGIGLVAGLTAINTFRVRVSSLVQTLTTLVPIAVLTVGALLVLLLGPPAEPATSTPSAPTSAASWGLAWAEAYTAVYFAYSGWNAVIYVAGEVEEPGTTLPFGLVGGTLGVTAVYMVLCAAFVVTLGYGGLAEAAEAGTATARAAAGPTAGLVVTGIIAVAMIASMNATVLGGARVAYAMARQEAFPDYFGELNGYEVPARALWIQAAIAGVFIATGTFSQILDLVGLAMMFVGAMTVAAIWVLRWDGEERERPYEALGFPWLPAVYLLSSALVVVVRVGQAVGSEKVVDWYPIYGLGIFVVALIVGWVWTRKRGSAEP